MDTHADLILGKMDDKERFDWEKAFAAMVKWHEDHDHTTVERWSFPSSVSNYEVSLQLVDW